MVKLIFCLRRKEGLSREEFQRYWRDTHAPLVAGHAGVLGIRRYVQSHTTDTPFNGALRASRGGPDEYDGVAELWWDSLETLAAGSSSTEGQVAAAALLEDERRFIDLANSPLFVVEENPVVG
jgi:uncharacterized protein (TIGR02118 family)